MNEEKRKPAKIKVLKNSLLACFVSLLMIFGFVPEEFSSHFDSIVFIGIPIIFIISLIINLGVYKNEAFYYMDNKINYEFLFILKKRVSLPLEKINIVKVKRGIFDYLFKTSTVEIGSGSVTKNSRPEIKLTLSVNEAEEFSEEIQAYSKLIKEGKEITKEEVVKPLVLDEIKMTTSDKFRKVLTLALGSTLIVAFFYLFFTGVIKYFIIQDVINDQEFIEFFALLSFKVLGLGLLFTAVVNMVFVFLSYYDFRILKYVDKLEIKCGLLQRKQIFIPMDKVHGVTVTRSLIGQILKIGSLKVNVIGISDVAENNTQKEQFFYPCANISKLATIIKDFLPEFDLQFNPAKTNSKSFKHTVVFPYLIALIFIAPFLVLAAYFLVFAVYVFLFYLCVAILGSILKYQYASICVSPDYSFFTSGGMIKSQTILKTKSIQEIRTYAGFIRRKDNLATYVIVYKGQGFQTNRLRVKNVPLIDLSLYK